MNPQVSTLIEDAREAIVQRTGGHLRLLVLYGSEARGEATPESDIDMLAILDCDDPQVKKLARDAVYDIMWQHDFLRLISLRFMTASDFKTQSEKGFSFVKNVEEEGVVLWPAA